MHNYRQEHIYEFIITEKHHCQLLKVNTTLLYPPKCDPVIFGIHVILVILDLQVNMLPTLPTLIPNR